MGCCESSTVISKERNENKVKNKDKNILFLKDSELVTSNIDLNILTMETIFKKYKNSYVSTFENPNLYKNFKDKSISELLEQSYVQMCVLKNSLDLFVKEFSDGKKYLNGLMKENKYSNFMKEVILFQKDFSNYESNENKKVNNLIENFKNVLNLKEDNLAQQRSVYIIDKTGKKYDDNKMKLLLNNVHDYIENTEEKNKKFDNIQKVLMLNSEADKENLKKQ